MDPRHKPLLILGAQGQVGQDLTEQLQQSQLPWVGLDLPDFDLRQASQIADAIAQHRPQLIINLAAYTAVDQAESEPDTADAINHHAVAELAKQSHAHAIPLIHLSTDYIFDGEKGQPYRENDLPRPLNTYGQSKWQGEQAVRRHNPQHLILRTAWVFGRHGNNFVKTILRLAHERPRLSVVNDQHGNPTPAAAIAATLIAISQRYLDKQTLPWGDYHYAGQPDTNWYQFAQAILQHTQLNTPIDPVPSSQYPTAAARPKDTRLDSQAIEQQLQQTPPHWPSHLKQLIQQIHSSPTPQPTQTKSKN